MGKNKIDLNLLHESATRLGTYLNQLESQLVDLQHEVEKMSSDTWYGGANANKWYSSMSTAFEKDVKFLNAKKGLLNNLNDRIKTLSGTKTKKKGNSKGGGIMGPVSGSGLGNWSL